jgi:rubrerythrin
MSLADDIKNAFISESEVNRKYLSYARKAENEGLEHVARLFRAVADAKGIHAYNHLRASKEVKSSMENLKAALEKEINDFKDMYGTMIEHAHAEGDKWCIKSFSYAQETERLYIQLFQDSLDTFGKQEDEKIYYVCKVCGLIVVNDLPEKCPLCGSRKKVFKKVG